ncbi:hypothetical protein BFP72_07340 [Reichenbachiella sp. 5M10]|uniref:GlcG/HbpS family heme-binding protein n=1 Tax=Reichenbachiella sp. 5M10 TaxID=1889772 RepID=UPI000C15EAC9|nr:heme-binding protein [Reichenbachiella sp. 5M10]PIB35223.1 hypothetical protein BFP72_07340 [Reichenbachiella sp. 5M10]
MELKQGIKAINTVIHACIRENKEAIVAVVDPHGELVTFARTDKAALSDIQVAINKGYTAARTQQDTQAFAQKLQANNPEHIRYYDDPRIVSWPGGIPVMDPDRQLIGAIGVSGLSDEDNHTLAQLAVQSLQPEPAQTDKKIQLYS